MQKYIDPEKQTINSPCVKEERGPDPVELVRGVPLPEGEQPAHVVHAAHLKQNLLRV